MKSVTLGPIDVRAKRWLVRKSVSFEDSWPAIYSPLDGEVRAIVKGD